MPQCFGCVDGYFKKVLAFSLYLLKKKQRIFVCAYFQLSLMFLKNTKKNFLCTYFLLFLILLRQGCSVNFFFLEYFMKFSFMGISWNIKYFYFSILITSLSEICFTSLIALFWNSPLFWNFSLMICNFPLLFSHPKNIRMSTLITIIVIYQLLIINYYSNNYKKSQ